MYPQTKFSTKSCHFPPRKTVFSQEVWTLRPVWYTVFSCVHDYLSDRFLPSPIHPILITDISFDTYPSVVWGCNGSHGQFASSEETGRTHNRRTFLRESDNNELRGLGGVGCVSGWQTLMTNFVTNLKPCLPSNPRVFSDKFLLGSSCPWCKSFLFADDLPVRINWLDSGLLVV